MSPLWCRVRAEVVLRRLQHAAARTASSQADSETPGGNGKGEPRVLRVSPRRRLGKGRVMYIITSRRRRQRRSFIYPIISFHGKCKRVCATAVSDTLRQPGARLRRHNHWTVVCLLLTLTHTHTGHVTPLLRCWRCSFKLGCFSKNQSRMKYEVTFKPVKLRRKLKSRLVWKNCICCRQRDQDELQNDQNDTRSFFQTKTQLLVG